MTGPVREELGGPQFVYTPEGLLEAARCFPCMNDEHATGPHTWGDRHDFEHAAAAALTPPGNCGCPCATPRVRVRAGRQVFVLSAPGRPARPFRVWVWACPECDAGVAASGQRALADAVAHRWSDACKWRRRHA